MVKKKEIREETPEERRERLMSEIEEIGKKHFVNEVLKKFEGREEELTCASIKGYTKFNAPHIGICYWFHVDGGCGWEFVERVYSVRAGGDRNIPGMEFHTMEEAENYIKKTKSKAYRNPFRISLSVEFTYHRVCTPEISDYALDLIEEPLLEVKTVIYEEGKRCRQL